MDATQEELNRLQERIRVLEYDGVEAQKKLSWLKEMLSSQKMMLDDAVAYATRLEARLSQYQS